MGSAEQPARHPSRTRDPRSDERSGLEAELAKSPREAGKSVKIKALKIEYKSVEDGKWRDEGFNDEEINPGATDTVKSGAKLEHIEGQTMQSIKLHYKMWCGGKWSVTYTTTDSSFSDAKCVYGKTYRVAVPSGGC